MQREDSRPVEPAGDHRRRTRRAERHATSEAIHLYEDDDLDAAVSTRSVHDIGHKTSRKAPAPSKRGRPGFKVWKTSFWKRRTAIRRDKAIAERQLADEL